EPMPEPKPDETEPAPGGVYSIKPPALTADRVEKALPSTVASVAVGGGGRYLVLHMPEVRKLAVFDVNEAKIAHQIPLAEENILFTAGLDKLIVVFPDKNLLQRWSMTTGQRETSGVLQSRGTV